MGYGVGWNAECQLEFQPQVEPDLQGSAALREALAARDEAEGVVMCLRQVVAPKP